jgi:hypothetical protein
VYVYNVVFYETTINDERISLSVLICRPSQRKREREKEEKFCVLWAKEIIFFQKREKTD